ncbi:MAG: hypothetical protein AABW50_00715 [Nanoarchaeota archaeon]
MAKRSKRLKLAIESLEKQKELHLVKKKIAEELGQEELVRYYEKEIESLEKRRKDREEKLER